MSKWPADGRIMKNKPHWPDVLSGVRAGASQGEWTSLGSSWDFHLKGQGLKISVLVVYRCSDINISKSERCFKASKQTNKKQPKDKNKQNLFNAFSSKVMIYLQIAWKIRRKVISSWSLTSSFLIFFPQRYDLATKYLVFSHSQNPFGTQVTFFLTCILPQQWKWLHIQLQAWASDILLISPLSWEITEFNIAFSTGKYSCSPMEKI